MVASRSLFSLAVLGAILVTAVDPGVAATPDFPLPQEKRDRLAQALDKVAGQYDPEARMLREPFRSPGYHTTLNGGQVHSTRSSLTYAVALLDTADEALRQRAEDILLAVIALQDTDPASRTYGIWPWFLEEPLRQMSPPDWNWADFCGVQLLQVALEHRERIRPEVMVKVEAAIGHAARSIQRRNMGPGYTNIAIMGTYVTLVAAELYGWPDLREYAIARWRKFHQHTRDLGGFTEYNSPTYTIVALTELGRMRRHVKDPEMRQLTEEIYRMAWEEVALHFHEPTRQWAGPHSRSYSTLLRHEVLGLIARATQGRFPAPPTEPTLTEQRGDLPCPRDLEPYFQGLPESRELVRAFTRTPRPVIGTTYLHPHFTLGSVNRGDFWNQRRAILAYWGTPAKPGYLHVRVLRDDYDFAAAQCFSAQRQGDVLAAVVFATDGGNTHVSLDRLTNGVVRAKDLRVRFEFGGEGRPEKVPAPDALNQTVTVDAGKVNISFAVPFAAFHEEKPRWQQVESGGRMCLDLVLIEGQERELRLEDLERAAVGIAIRVAEPRATWPAVRAGVHAARLDLEWDALRVSVPLRPRKTAELQEAFN